MLLKKMFLSIILLFIISVLENAASKSLENLNYRPIIGIIAEETNPDLSKYGSSYISAAYVKFVESAGARVVPIVIYESEEYYKNIFSKVNGVLFTGGADNLKSKGYGRTGGILFDMAVEANDKGDYFPLWGTCLGFELLNYLVANNTMWMKACDAEDVATTLKLTPALNTSKMFHDVNPSLVNIMQVEKVASNFHHWCLTPQNYSFSGLDKFFKILSISQDSKGLKFVSIIEGQKYPFYGVAFHPEEVLFEWLYRKGHLSVPHTYNAVTVSQHFANFFVNEARKSKHKFASKEDEDQVLIYNYTPYFTGKENFSTQQIYFFS